MTDAVDTAGRRALLALLQGTTQVEVALAIGVSRTSVSWWSSGKTRPSRRARRALSAVYGIAPEAWGRLPARWVSRESYRRNVECKL